MRPVVIITRSRPQSWASGVRKTLIKKVNTVRQHLRYWTTDFHFCTESLTQQVSTNPQKGIRKTIGGRNENNKLTIDKRKEESVWETVSDK